MTSHHFVAAIRATPLGTHNRGEYDSQLIDFDAEFHLSLESRNAILKAFYIAISTEGWDMSLFSCQALVSPAAVDWVEHYGCDRIPLGDSRARRHESSYPIRFLCLGAVTYDFQ